MSVLDRYELLRQDAVNIALAEEAKGVKEVGAQNRGPEIDIYKKRAHSPLTKNHGWCGFFIYYCYSEAAKKFGFPLPFSAGPLWSGPKLRRWAKKNPDFVVNTSPCLPGDIYVMNYGHIGMVVSQSDGTFVNTIDGNQSSMGKGKSVKKQYRNILEMDVLIRVTEAGMFGACYE
ncbi:MAG: CHAP domain-containing protein [Acidobacteria bacterium]|nr:MAG: CHAP domain-containing protein [Acidobacteriota bacterium]REK01725.1 MAG: CHAP domain-containing protein [Acidobacteriota bacterium]REK14681.1 MAG: CHAP domain-containing protein [Acidobacteriota bacterium]REK45396.1 MAG: CHAP domain-containing protein [Acidobacteriota bacterium]